MAIPHANSTENQTRVDWSATSPSIAIIEELAILEDCDPKTLADRFDPLYEYIDPDALDMLVTADSSVTVTFDLEEYRIQLDRSSLCIWVD